MTDSEFVNVNELPPTPAFLCPFLATLDDAETYSANVNFKNYCYKASPVQSVSIDHQIHICCTEEYRNCIIYKSTQKCNLPAEWLYVESDDSFFSENRRRWLVIAGIVLVCFLIAAFVYLFLFSGLFHSV